VKATGVALLVLLPAALAACGLHLRTAPNLPPQMRVIYVSAPGQNAELVRALRRNLASENTDVVLDPTDATATLSILHGSQYNRPLTFNNLGRPVEYEAAYEVEFSLIAGGVVVIEPQTITLKHSYNFSPSNAVGNEEQANAEYSVLAQEMARLMIFRIRAAAKNLAPAAPTAAGTKAVPAPPARTATLTPPATTQSPPVP
jgi:LPS-assembly lipoprotein